MISACNASTSDVGASIVGDWAMIEAQLPPNWRDIAEARRLISPGSRRPQLGAKIADPVIPLRLLLYRAATDNSLKTTAATGHAGELVDMSAPALHYWERKMGPFFADLVVAMADAEHAFAPERWAGYDIVLHDASAVCRPGAEGTTAKVHYGLRLTSLRLVGVEVTDGNGGETFRRFDVEPGELHMGDRAYANPPGIAYVNSQGGDVLVRYNRGALPLYDIARERLDVREKLAKLRKPNRVREWAAWVRPEDGQPIAGRLVAVRLPEDKAEEARERLRREQGKAVTPESLAMAEFVVIFTTAPKTKLSAERVLELYGLRWQVELHIKRDKSIAGLDELRNRRPDTIYAWLCAKLLLTQIARKLTSSSVSIPPSGPRTDLPRNNVPSGATARRNPAAVHPVHPAKAQTVGTARRCRAVAHDGDDLASRLGCVAAN